MENKENLLFIPSSGEQLSRKEQLELWKQKKLIEKSIIPKPAQKGLSSRFLESKHLTQRKPSGSKKQRNTTELNTPSRPSLIAIRIPNNTPLRDLSTSHSDKPETKAQRVSVGPKERNSIGAEGRKILSIEKRVESFAPVLNEEFETLLTSKLSEVHNHLKDGNLTDAYGILDQVEKWGIIDDTVTNRNPTEKALQKKKTSARKKIIEGKADYWVQRARFEEARENYSSVIDLYELALQIGAKPTKVLEQGLKVFLLRIMPSAAYATIHSKTRRMSVSPAFLLDLEKEEREFSTRTSLPVPGLASLPQLVATDHLCDQKDTTLSITLASDVADEDREEGEEWEDVEDNEHPLPRAQDSDHEDTDPEQHHSTPQEEQIDKHSTGCRDIVSGVKLDMKQVSTPSTDRRNPFSRVVEAEITDPFCEVEEHPIHEEFGLSGCTDDFSHKLVTATDASAQSKRLGTPTSARTLSSRYHHRCRTPGLPVHSFSRQVATAVRHRTPIPPPSVIGTPSKVSRSSLVGLPQKVLSSNPAVFTPLRSLPHTPHTPHTPHSHHQTQLHVSNDGGGMTSTPELPQHFQQQEETADAPDIMAFISNSTEHPQKTDVKKDERSLDSQTATVNRTCNTPVNQNEKDHLLHTQLQEADIDYLSTKLHTLQSQRTVHDEIEEKDDKREENKEEEGVTDKPDLGGHQEQEEVLKQQGKQETAGEGEGDQSEAEVKPLKPQRQSFSSRRRSHLLTPQKVQADTLQSLITPTATLGRYDTFIPLKNAPQTESFSNRRKARKAAGDETEEQQSISSRRKKSIVVTPVRRCMRLSAASRLHPTSSLLANENNLFLQPNIFLPPFVQQERK